MGSDPNLKNDAQMNDKSRLEIEWKEPLFVFIFRDLRKYCNRLLLCWAKLWEAVASLQLRTEAKDIRAALPLIQTRS